MENPRDTADFFRLAALRVIFLKKTKNTFLKRSREVCVQNFRSVLFFVLPGDVTHIHKYMSEFKNILDPLLASRGF